MVHHCTDDSLQDVTNEEEEEGFPTAPLDDDILDGRTSLRQALLHP